MAGGTAVRIPGGHDVGRFRLRPQCRVRPRPSRQCDSFALSDPAMGKPGRFVSSVRATWASPLRSGGARLGQHIALRVRAPRADRARPQPSARAFASTHRATRPAKRAADRRRRFQRLALAAQGHSRARASTQHARGVRADERSAGAQFPGDASAVPPRPDLYSRLSCKPRARSPRPCLGPHVGSRRAHHDSRTDMTEYLDGNQLTLLESGREYFPALEAACDAARIEIHVETYIYEDDEAGERISAALIRAARRGVNTHLLVDGYGSK